MALSSGSLLCLAVLFLSCSAQLWDYAQIQSNVNDLTSEAEKDILSIRASISEFVLSTTDEMISYATNSIDESGNDPRAPMIGACTLYPTNYLNHYTKEINAKVASSQSQVNSLKFTVLRSLVNQPMISEPEATFNAVQLQATALANIWPTAKATLESEVEQYKTKVYQLVEDMKNCIAIVEV